ncbi:MAG: M48 family metalloprotease [Planctomycetota bacterium]
MSRLACLLLVAAAAGCDSVGKSLEKIGAKKVESETGVSTETMVKTAKALTKSLEEITPEQEYYIGRAVAAEILAQEAVLEDDALTAYVNRVGQTVAQASGRPDVFGGYHVILLETDDVNALAAPGAFLFVTRGLLRQCRTEDELAAVLAHEVIHIERQDGIRMIRQSERFQALVDLGLEAALESGDVAVLREALGKMASELATTLLTSGYSRSIESDADLRALALLDRVGYRPAALKELVARLDAAAGATKGSSLFASHESLGQREEALSKELTRYSERPEAPARQARFEAAFASARG